MQEDQPAVEPLDVADPEVHEEPAEPVTPQQPEVNETPKPEEEPAEFEDRW